MKSLLFASAWCLGAALMSSAPAAEAEFVPPSYVVRRTAEPITADGKLDEPAWFAAESMGEFHFPWFKEGRREQTVVKLLWDDRNLYIACLCEDAHITARTSAHDGPVSADDCIEIMAAPDAQRPAFYFNLEWNVLGGYVDGHRPNGAEGGRVEWNAEGVEIAGVARGTLNDDADEDASWCVEVVLPLANFRDHMPHVPPRDGDQWRVNFNRHGGDVNQQYSQWSPGDAPAPAFHAPHRFGRLIFSNGTLPFAADADR